MGDNKNIFCDWCGQKEYYISVYEDNSNEEESLICEDCFKLLA